MSFNLTFYGGVGTVTGANYLLENGDVRILIDCGLFQGFKFCEKENRENFPYDPASIDYLFVTHSHMDHIGRIPKLVRDGFGGEIYSTPETKMISEAMLLDALEIMQNESKNSGGETLYQKEDISKALSLWKTFPYHQKLSIKGGVEVLAKDAGHILGSAMYEFSSDGRKIAFTGDLGNSPSPLLNNTENVDEPDYLIMESVYGDRNHESKEKREEEFKRIIKESVARGGALLIPAFSLERTQVILFELNKLVESGQITSVPVFLDSPLAAKVTEIYKNSESQFNGSTKWQIKKGDDIFNFPKLKITLKTNDSKSIADVQNPKIIIAGSGMSSGGRVIHHEALYLPDQKSTLLLMGYQTPGTLGRQIQDGAKKVKILNTEVKIRAKVETISGYSAHKDSDHLVEFVAENSKNLKKVFVVMGEPKASLFLVQKLRDNLGVDAICPEKDKEYKLD